MFLSTKPKNFFFDSSEHAILLARTSRLNAPLVIEEIVECAPDDAAALGAAVVALQSAKSSSGYLHSTCGINVGRRVVRKVTLELKRIKEANYLNEVTAQQVRIEPDHYSLALVHPLTGAEYDVSKASHKEVLICGLPSEDLDRQQDGLLAAGIYPESIELSTVATLGALVDYLSFAKIKIPVLVLEVEAHSTNSYIVTAGGVDASRPIPHGLDSMIPVVQKELGLKDEASARKLFLSNTFDFTGMGSLLIKKLVKELQSSIGFFEVQTGQSIGHVACVLLPAKLAWLETAIAADLGVTVLKMDIPAWLQSHQISFADHLSATTQDIRRLGLFSLMVQYNQSHAAFPEKAQ